MHNGGIVTAAAYVHPICSRKVGTSAIVLNVELSNPEGGVVDFPGRELPRGTGTTFRPGRLDICTVMPSCSPHSHGGLAWYLPHTHHSLRHLQANGLVQLSPTSVNL